MIDISHPSKEAIKQMIELSKAPVIASHSSARALRDHPRNLDDEQLELIKNNGGVIHISEGSILTYGVTQKNYKQNSKTTFEIS